jgi:hypothetical protein
LDYIVEKTIQFTENYEPQDDSGQVFEAGKVYTMNPASARHFCRRGVAVEVGKELASEDEKPEPFADEIEHVGGGWYQLPNGERVKGKGAALEAMAELANADAAKTLADDADPDARPGKTLGE